VDESYISQGKKGCLRLLSGVTNELAGLFTHEYLSIRAIRISLVASSPNSRHTDPKALVSKNY
jgi:hypothetical protein